MSRLSLENIPAFIEIFRNKRQIPNTLLIMDHAVSAHNKIKVVLHTGSKHKQTFDYTGIRLR